MQINRTNKSRQLIELLLVLALAMLLRLPNFFLSHLNNDELIYCGLAHKIDRYGIKAFNNLYKIKNHYNLYFLDKGFDYNSRLLGILESEKREGTLLDGFLGEREQLSHHPPLLPFFLAVSHRIFLRKLPFVLNAAQTPFFMRANASYQFYACFVPFLFSLLFLISVYVLSRIIFSHHIGLLATLFVAFTPITILTSCKIWADDMVAFFFTLAVIFYVLAKKSNKYFYALFSGLSCGLAILAKMSGLYLIFIILIFHIIENRNKKVSFRNVVSFIFDKNILYFLAGVFIASGWWLDLFLLNFGAGSIKYNFSINENWHAAKTWSDFFGVVSNRPWYSYFILIPFQFPLYLFGYIFIILWLIRQKFRSLPLFRDKSNFINFVIIWVMVVVGMLTLKPGKELRYTSVALGGIAFLSSLCLFIVYERVKKKLDQLNQFTINVIFIFPITMVLVYALIIAIPRLFKRIDLIIFPF